MHKKTLLRSVRVLDVAMELRSAVRRLRRAPGLVAVATVVIGFGLALHFTAVAVERSLFSRALGVADVDGLVYIRAGSDHSPIEIANLESAIAGAVSSVGSHRPMSMAMQSEGVSRTLFAELVSANYFSVLRVNPLRGRLLGDSDADANEMSPAVVISEPLWKGLGATEEGPDSLGAMVLDGRRYRVVGVVPERFKGLSDPWRPAQVWTTFEHFFGGPRDKDVEIAEVATATSPFVFGRLAPDQTLGQLQQRLNAFGSSQTSGPRSYRAQPAAQVPLPFHPPEDSRAIEALFTSIYFSSWVVIGIGLFNLVGLLLARLESRRSEMAVQRVLGASTSRLSLQIIAETTLLGVLAGAVGLILSALGVAAYARLDHQMALPVGITWDVFLYSFFAALLVGVVLGVVLVLWTRRLELVGGQSLYSQSRPLVSGRVRSLLLVPQVFVASVTLVVGLSHADMLWRLNSNERGFETENRFMFVVTPSAEVAGKERTAQETFHLLTVVEQELSAQPGVVAVGFTSFVPTTLSGAPVRAVVGRSTFGDTERSALARSGGMVSDGYFRALGIPILRGRAFDYKLDQQEAERVVIVSDRLAKLLWPDSDPIGQLLARVTPNGQESNRDWRRVVGVVDDVRHYLSATEATPLWYGPASQGTIPSGTGLSLIMHSDDQATTAVVAKTLGRIDPFVTTSDVQSFRQVVDRTLYPHKLATGILSTMGIGTLALVSIGLFGLMAYSAQRNIHEFGIRVALGATRPALAWGVCRSALIMATAVLLPATAVGFWATGLTGRLLGNTVVVTPLIVVAVFTTIFVVLVAAAYLPVYSACRKGPASALRVSQ